VSESTIQVGPIASQRLLHSRQPLLLPHFLLVIVMPQPISNGRVVRVDTDHAVLELMATAVSRINGSLTVEIQDRLVQVSGQAGSWHEKQLAQESLRSVCSSYRICNNIRVAAWD